MKLVVRRFLGVFLVLGVLCFCFAGSIDNSATRPWAQSLIDYVTGTVVPTSSVAYATSARQLFSEIGGGISQKVECVLIGGEPVWLMSGIQSGSTNLWYQFGGTAYMTTAYSPTFAVRTAYPNIGWEMVPINNAAWLSIASGAYLYKFGQNGTVVTNNMPNFAVSNLTVNGSQTNNGSLTVLGGGNVITQGMTNVSIQVAAPISGSSPVTLDFVNALSLGGYTYYLNGGVPSADLVGYYQMSPTSQVNLTTNTIAGVTNNQYLLQFATASNGVTAEIVEEGNHTITVWARQTAGTQSAQLKSEGYIKNKAGVDLYEVPSSLASITAALGANFTRYDMNINLLTNITSATTNRWSIKIKSVITGLGTAPTIEILSGNGFPSHAQGPYSPQGGFLPASTFTTHSNTHQNVGGWLTMPGLQDNTNGFYAPNTIWNSNGYLAVWN